MKKDHFSKLEVEPLDEFVEGRRVYRLTKDFTFTSEEYGVITVPAGFKTDFASVPAIVRSIFPTDGKYMEASIVHDYYYAYAIGTKKLADRIFKHAMKLSNVSTIRRWLMYWGVRLMGKGQYGKTISHIPRGHIYQDIPREQVNPRKK